MSPETPSKHLKARWLRAIAEGANCPASSGRFVTSPPPLRDKRDGAQGIERSTFVDSSAVGRVPANRLIWTRLARVVPNPASETERRESAPSPVATSLRGPQDPASAYLERLAPGSRPTMSAALEAIAGLAAGVPTSAERFPWHAMTYRETGAVRAALLGCGYAPATVNRMLTALRGVLREAWLLGLMPSEVLHRAIAVRNVKASTLPRGRTVSQDELAAVFAACARDGRAAGCRDAAAIALVVGCGLRRAEAAALDAAHVDVDTGLVVVHGGKGRKDRVVYMPPGTKTAVEAWLGLRGSNPGPLLWAVEGGRGAGLAGERLSPHALYAILKRRAAEAEVAAFAPHDLRRTFVSEVLERTADLALASELAGHSDPRTTKRYDLRGAETKRRACGLLEVPFVKGGKER